MRLQSPKLQSYSLNSHPSPLEKDAYLSSFIHFPNTHFHLQLTKF